MWSFDPFSMPQIERKAMLYLLASTEKIHKENKKCFPNACCLYIDYPVVVTKKIQKCLFCLSFLCHNQLQVFHIDFPQI